ncbi:MAG: glycosyltransferase family 1 protein [Chloroflexi bacterium]|nr:glycosyltransferase family 1 protein [Chloroflexota bacterium]
MARVLISAVPASGHVNPLIAIALALEAQGDHVGFVSGQTVQPQIERTGLQFFTLPYPPGAVEEIMAAFREPARWTSQLRRKPPQAHFFDYLEMLTQHLIGTINAFQADVLLTDLNFYAGPIAADATQLPYASYCAIVNTLLTPDAPPYGLGSDWVPSGHWRRYLWPWLGLPMRLVVMRHDRAINATRRRFGLPAISGGLLTHSPYLALVPTTDAYAYPRKHVPANLMYIGPVTTSARGEVYDDFPWEWLAGDEPTVYASMGTVVGSVALFQNIIEATRGATWKAVLAVGRNTDPAGFHDVPTNVLIRQFVPQLELLPHVDAVISHGGNNTVSEALLHGKPLVVIPISADQPESAARVKACGAGIRLRPGAATPERLRVAIERLLTDPRHRTAAEHVQTSYQRTNGPETGARLVNLLATLKQPISRPNDLGPTIEPEDVDRIIQANRS